jgi:hypothetical protein
MAIFICPTCKKIWGYKIEKCPYCFESLKREKCKNVKVKFINQTTIPSIFHQKVPYYVLVLEDENKRKFLQKSTKLYQANEPFELEKSQNKNKAVAIWRKKYDFFEPIEKIFEIFDINLKPDQKILISPTIKSPNHPHSRENTSPEFLEGIFDFLLESGLKAENITIMNQSFDNVSLIEKLKKSQILTVCERKKINVFDISQGEFLEKEGIKITKKIFETDFILNAPILNMKKAEATENLFCLIEKENLKVLEYFSEKNEIFKKLESHLPQIFTLAEANQVQNENGVNFYLNLVLGSFNPKNLDAVFYKIVKRKIPEIIKDVEIEKIEVVGRKIEEVETFI